MDGNVFPNVGNRDNENKKSRDDWRILARQVQESPHGLMQGVLQRPDGDYVIAIRELDDVLKWNKDIAENLHGSVNWLNAQPDFDDVTAMIHRNTYFGYSPSNLHFQRLTLTFWER
jgi:hypothetical protein